MQQRPFFYIPATSPPFKIKAYNVAIVFFSSVLWAALVVGSQYADNPGGLPAENAIWSFLSPFLGKVKLPPWESYFIYCVFAPLVETVIYCSWPLLLTQMIMYRSHADAKLESSYFTMSILAISIIFGMAHGGYFNILLQGVIGLLFCRLFLINRNCYWSTVIAHALYNAVAITGQSYFTKS